MVEKFLFSENWFNFGKSKGGFCWNVCMSIEVASDIHEQQGGSTGLKRSLGYISFNISENIYIVINN